MDSQASVVVEPNEAERLAAVRAVQSRFQRQLRAGDRAWPLRLLVVLAVSGAIGFAFAEFFTLYPWLLPLLAGGALLGFAHSFNRKQMRALAQGQSPQYRVSLTDSGLTVESDRGVAHVSPHTVEAIETNSQAVVIHLQGPQVLWIPSRCFFDAAAQLAFVSCLEQCVGKSASAHPEMISPPADAASTSFAADLGRNLVAGLRLVLLSKRAAGQLSVSPAQLIALVLLQLAVAVIGDAVRTGSGHFNPQALPGALWAVPWLLMTAWMAARARDDESLTLRAAVALQTVWVWMSVVSYALSLAPTPWWNSLGLWSEVLWWAPFVWGVIASVPAVIRALGMLPEQRVGAILAVVYLFAIPVFLLPRSVPLWLPGDEGAESTEERMRWNLAAQEEVLYAQPRLLQEALDQVSAGQPGVAELFLVAVAGHGAQDVFLNEVESVDKLFAERFGTRERSVLLVNNPETVLEQPMATVTALEKTLLAVGQRMNADEDVLVLFMTSHGSEDHRFDLSLWPYKLNELTPARLKSALDKAGIRHRVLVLSSCYSGGFLPVLKNDNSLVITASRADRSSHGCEHGADWTFFGKAFFDEALRRTHSFEAAFEQASKAVAQREAAEGYEPSEPQLAVGQALRPRLRAVEAQLK